MSNSKYIQASAGTGKTYEITKIVNNLVNNSNIPISEILIVTFTEKAAGELRERIRKTIGEQHSDEIANAPIYTIHSFCQTILREFPFESGENLEQKLIDENKIKDFIDLELRSICPPEFDCKKLVEFFVPACLLYKEGVEIKESLSIKYSKAKNAADLLEIPGIKELLERCSKEETHKAIVEYIAKINEWTPEKIFFDRIGETKFVSKENYKKVKEYKDAFKERIIEEEPFVREHLEEIISKWKAYKVSEGLQSYNDMIDRVAQKIKEKDFLAAIQKKYKYAIIDEFQDTNKTQWNIFKTIFLDSPEHTIIVVGDPKQSIFSFQGTDVSVYNSAITQIGNPGTLDTNYRSTNEMVSACNALFSDTAFSSLDYSPVKYSSTIDNPKFNGQSIKPLLILENPDPSDAAEVYANLVAKKIIEFVSLDDKGNTKLQVYDKDKKPLRDVSLRDFAVICRARSENDEIIKAFNKYHIPYHKYKDKNLFNTPECAMWISLFKALNQDDFNGESVRILNELLISNFFYTKINDEHTKHFILSLHKLIKDGKYAEMLDALYEQSSINQVYNSVKTTQSLGIIQQIGDYSINYLYQKNSSVDSLINHLISLKDSSEGVEDENGNLIQKNSDFDAVQILTAYAAKGLEFPVVISTIGNKGLPKDNRKAYIYHDSNNNVCLGFDDYTKNKKKEEIVKELDRLFYVAYTRASSIMILPTLNWLKNNGKPKDGTETIANAFCPDGANINPCLKGFYAPLEVPNKTYTEWKNELLKTLEKGRITKDGAKSAEQQSQTIVQTNELMPLKIRRQHSYSSLTYHNNTKTPENHDNPEAGDSRGIEQKINYPRGASLGNALHNTMEELCKASELNFKYFEKRSLDEVLENSELYQLIDNNFRAEGLINKSEEIQKQWINYSISIIWNTLNAELEGCIRLNTIESKDSIAEMEYYMDSSKEDFEALCKGFLDLVFRKSEKYYILDWKSDSLDSYDNHSIEKTVDERYHIQRVLYPYFLINWLSNILNKDPETVFNENFGGIYYVFFRGTKASTSQGTYLKNWSSYAELADEYKEKVGNKIIAIAHN